MLKDGMGRKESVSKSERTAARTSKVRIRKKGLSWEKMEKRFLGVVLSAVTITMVVLQNVRRAGKS